MRIVFMRSNPISPDSRVEKEADTLISAGHEVIILGWDRGNEYDYKEDELKCYTGNAKIIRFGIPAVFGGGIKRNLFPLLKIQKRMRKWLVENRDLYDVIHACDFDNGIVAKKIAKKYHKKFVYDVFDYYSASHSFPKLLKKMIIKSENKVISSADATIICSEQRIKQIEGSTPKRLVIIHNSPYKEILSMANEDFSLMVQSDKVKIGYVGILSRARLLKEIVECISMRDDVEFHIGGFGQLNDYMKEASNIYSNIYYYGKISYPDTLKLEEEVDILTAIYDPSVDNHKYAAPNKFYESLMLGKPLIMIHNTGMDSIVDKYDLGVTIDFNKNDFNKALDKLIMEKNNWYSISDRAKKVYDDFYSWEIMGKRLKDLYEDLKNE